MSTLWCGDPSAHEQHEWIGHHGRLMDCPGDDGTRPARRTFAGLLLTIDGRMPDDVVFFAPVADPVDGTEVGDGGYARMSLSSRGWGTLREAGDRLTFGKATGPALSGEVLDLALPELPDAWTRILELGERSAARLQPADACGGGDPLVDEPVGAAPRTRAGSGGTRERRSVDHDQEDGMANPNPNEYDEDAYSEAATRLRDAMIAMWAAGADEATIEAEFADALPDVSE